MIIVIRRAIGSDVSAMRDILTTIELFPPEMLADMIHPFLNEKDSSDFWCTAIFEGDVVGLAYCAVEQFTEGTMNLLALGVHADYHGKGIGARIIDYVEKHLSEHARILLIETSSSESQAAARHLYLKKGYTQEATIREYWGEGDDKIIFWKKLDSESNSTF